MPRRRSSTTTRICSAPRASIRKRRRRPGPKSAEPRFQKGVCGIFIGSSATRADIKANSKFEVGYGMMPYWPDVQGTPQNTIIGGATLWVLRDRPRAEYAGVAKFFAYLSKPEIQAAWHQNTGYLPLTRAAFDLTRR